MKFLILLTILVLGYASVPPNFKRCHRKNPNFKKCYLEAAQHGITLFTKPYKALDLPSFEPLELASLVLNGGGGAVAVNQNYKQCKIYGLTTIKFNIFELDFDKKSLTIDGVIDEMVLKCHYQLDGKVLLIPVQGDGENTVIFKKFRLMYSASFEEYVKNGKTYYKVLQSEMQSEVGGVHFQFDNLFNGDKALGDNINLVINDNWKEILVDIQPEYNEAIKKIAENMLMKMWGSNSLEEFFD